MEDSFEAYVDNFEEIFELLIQDNNEKIREKTLTILSTYRLFNSDHSEPM